MRKKIGAFAVAASLLLYCTGCGLLPKEEELPVAPILTEGETDDYVVSQVARGDVIVTESIRATYVPSSSEKLSFALGDEKINKVYVSLGDTVQAGDLLMELDVSELDDRIRQQQDQLDDLYLELEHLYETEDISLSKAQLQDQQAAEGGQTDGMSKADEVMSEYSEQAQKTKHSIQVAEQRLKELEEEKADRQIHASIDGTVTYLYEFKDGEKSVKDEKVITLADMSQALFEVYSENKGMLEIGKTYTLTCDNGEYQVEAHTAEELNLPNTQPGGVYLTMLEPDPTLEQGVNGTVQLVIEESLDTLYVASGAVKTLRGETIVYCIDEQGLRKMKTVKVGISTEKVTEIVEGLEEGETIILE